MNAEAGGKFTGGRERTPRRLPQRTRLLGQQMRPQLETFHHCRKSQTRADRERERARGADAELPHCFTPSPARCPRYGPVITAATHSKEVHGSSWKPPRLPCLPFERLGVFIYDGITWQFLHRERSRTPSAANAETDTATHRRGPTHPTGGKPSCATSCRSGARITRRTAHARGKARTEATATGNDRGIRAHARAGTHRRTTGTRDSGTATGR
jgi:hypothetical protein